MPKSLIHQILITTGEQVQTSIIYCGDCQRVLPQALPDKSVDLIYMDPPFFSNRNYEVIWNDGYEMRSFEDRWKGGIENYVAWMEQKVRECYRVLKDSGSMYLHCDWHANHRLRVLMDSVFGESRFKNEIVWQRHKSHNDPKQLGRVHDTILFYTKTDDYTWNEILLPYAEGYSEAAFRYSDPDGRRYQTQPLHASKPGGDTYYEWKGQHPPKGRYWAFSKENMKKLDEEGRIVYSKTGVPRYKIYVDEAKGRPLQDVWTDIPPVHHKGKERLGFPTQKPEGLLERILKLSSNPDDIVLDPMCGCGTSLAVAHKLGRKWVGIDVSPTACRLIMNRLRKLGVQGAKIEGLPKTIEGLRDLQPFEFQNWICQKMFARLSERKVGDYGIDGWLMDGRPLQIKQSERVGRNVVDNFETAIKRMKKDRGVIVAFSFGKGAIEEVARVKNADGVEVELKTVEDIMREI